MVGLIEILCAHKDRQVSALDNDINLLRQTLTKHGKMFDIKVYAGAPHAFFNDTRESYRPEAAKDAWERTLSFLNNTLKR